MEEATASWLTQCALIRWAAIDPRFGGKGAYYPQWLITGATFYWHLSPLFRVVLFRLRKCSFVIWASEGHPFNQDDVEWDFGSCKTVELSPRAMVTSDTREMWQKVISQSNKCLEESCDLRNFWKSLIAMIMDCDGHFPLSLHIEVKWNWKYLS